MRIVLSLLTMLYFIFPLSAQEIIQVEGFWGHKFYQEGVRIKRSSVRAQLSKNNEAFAHWKDANKNVGIYLGMNTVVLVPYVIGMDKFAKTGEYKHLGLPIGAIGVMFLSKIWGNKSDRAYQSAVDVFNEKVELKDLGYHIQKPSFQPCMTANGIGLQVNF